MSMCLGQSAVDSRPPRRVEVEPVSTASLTPSIFFALIGVGVGEFIGGESGGGLGYPII